MPIFVEIRKPLVMFNMYFFFIISFFSSGGFMFVSWWFHTHAWQPCGDHFTNGNKATFSKVWLLSYGAYSFYFNRYLMGASMCCAGFTFLR